MGQTLEDVLLAHWPVPIDSVRAHVPAELKVELYDGSAWMSILPFRAAGSRLRGMLPVPGVSSFLELNVRTYVHAGDGKPGVWFFSLDVSSRLAAEAARRVYKLPVFHARMSTERSDDWIEVECSRFDERGRVFSGRYRAEGESFTPEPGSLESFLADRFCLYATNERGVAAAGGDPPRAVDTSACNGRDRPDDDLTRRARRSPALPFLAPPGRRALAARTCSLTRRVRYGAHDRSAPYCALLRLRRAGPDRAEARHGPRDRQPRCSLRGGALGHRPDRGAADVLRGRSRGAPGGHRATSTATARPSTSPRSPRARSSCSRAS